MAKKNGKSPKGRAKQKQKAQGQANGRSRGSDRFGSGPARYPQEFSDDDEDGTPRAGFRGFAQARTFDSSQQRGTNTKLRYQAISFVSAGSNMPPPELRPRPSKQLDTIAADSMVIEREEVATDTKHGILDELDDQDDAIQTNILTDTSEFSAPEDGLARMHIHSTPWRAGSSNDDVNSSLSSNFQIVGDDSYLDGQHAIPGSPEALPFFVDTTGDAKMADPVDVRKRMKVGRTPSPAPSDSSQEVIVFHGRRKPVIVDDDVPRNPTTTLAKPTVQNTADKEVVTPRPHVTDDLLHALQQPPTKPAGWVSKPSKFDDMKQKDATWTPAPSVPYWKKDRHGTGTSAGSIIDEKLRIKAAPTFQADERSGVLPPDTQSRTAKNKASAEMERRPGANEFVPLLQSSRRGKNQRKRGNRRMRKVIMDDEEDNDSEAAYDDYMANLVAQLEGHASGDIDNSDAVAKLFTARPLGLNDSTIVVDKLNAADKVSEGAMEDGSEWEDEDSDDSILAGKASAESSPNSSDLESDLEYNEREQWEDEEDLRQRRIDAMTDEQIARLLAKQEELGMEGDELMIDDGIYASLDDNDGVGDIEAARAGLFEITNSSSHRARISRDKRTRSRKGKGGHNYPDASLMADVIDQLGDEAFDIMDFDRPSLRPRKKGRKGQIPSPLEELSDEDLKQDMTTAWEKDRQKKRLRKLEREELRSEGLLGAAGRKGVADLKQKYRQGMTPYDIRAELREFLHNDQLEQRAFPPMLKQDRKSLHEFCVRLGLKSQSQGAGHNRFPIVYKTSRTVVAGSVEMQQVFEGAPRGRFGGRGNRKEMRKNGPGHGGGFSKAAASVRNGEIVGAGAAEIGSESFGHKLMEKMGWTKGMALGKDGEGRLVPVEQIVRIGTAGLG